MSEPNVHAETREKRKEGRINNTLHLWEFLLELLEDERYAPLISWTRKEEREFKIKRQEDVAHKWGRLKQRASMNYDKLSRALRYYYHKGIIKKVQGQRLVYKFDKLPYTYKPVKYNWPWKIPSEELEEKPVNRDRNSFSKARRRPKMSTWKVSAPEQLVKEVKQENVTPMVSKATSWPVVPAWRIPHSKQEVKHVKPGAIPPLIPIATPIRIPVVSTLANSTQPPVPYENAPRHPHSGSNTVRSESSGRVDSPSQSSSQTVCRSKIMFPHCSCVGSAVYGVRMLPAVTSVPVRVITRFV